MPSLLCSASLPLQTVVRMPKPKSKVKVLGPNKVQGVCSCGWEGLVFVRLEDVSAAMTAAQNEINAHKHIPAPPKVKKAKVASKKKV